VRVRLTVEERIALAVLLALLAGLVVLGFSVASSQGAEAPPMSKSAVLPPRVWYFAATATDSDELESDFSDELSLTETSRIATVTLAWDQSVSWSPSNPLTYRVYCGGKSRTYTNIVEAGTNLSVTVRLARLLKTNRLVVVSSTSTGMFYGDTMTGPWTYTSETNILTFNPSGNRFYRAVPGGAVRVTEAWL
jgi:hypothetical protein